MELSQKEFNILKGKAMNIWSQYDNAFGYAEEKIGRILPLKNSPDSVVTIYGMFDGHNQSFLADCLPGEIVEKVIAIYSGEK